jgi:AcrR family transcriptional regulator
MNNVAAIAALAPEAPAIQREPLSTSVVKILEGALRAVGSRGIRRLSMSDISAASGVSRGTLYKYFSTKEEVLEAVSEFVCSSFETGLAEVAAGYADPVARLSAVMRFFAQFTIERSPQHIFEIEPAFYLNFFRTHLIRHKIAVREALAPTFDHFEALYMVHVDRDALAEMLVRLQLSTLIVPPDRHWNQRWENASELVEQWIVSFRQKAAAEPA